MARRKPSQEITTIKHARPDSRQPQATAPGKADEKEYDKRQ